MYPLMAYALRDLVSYGHMIRDMYTAEVLHANMLWQLLRILSTYYGLGQCQDVENRIGFSSRRREDCGKTQQKVLGVDYTFKTNSGYIKRASRYYNREDQVYHSHIYCHSSIVTSAVTLAQPNLLSLQYSHICRYSSTITSVVTLAQSHLLSLQHNHICRHINAVTSTVTLAQSHLPLLQHSYICRYSSTVISAFTLAQSYLLSLQYSYLLSLQHSHICRYSSTITSVVTLAPASSWLLMALHNINSWTTGQQPRIKNNFCYHSSVPPSLT